MRKRKVLVALAGLAVVAAAGVVLWPRSQPSSRITRENFERIKEGMSRAEVETILGPPGDYSSGPLEYARETLYRFSSSGPPPTGDFVLSSPVTILGGDAWDRVEWRSDRQILCVYFLRSGHVIARGFWDVAPMAQSPLHNLLWRVKRQWHRWFPE
jgi:hypothetical protein